MAKKGLPNLSKENVGVFFIIIGLLVLWISINYIDTTENIENYITAVSVLCILLGLWIIGSSSAIAFF